MSRFELLKTLHIACAFLSIGGFSLRGYWMITDSRHLRARASRILPHIVDTVLLASAICMLVILHTNPLSIGWLSAKLLALLLYIGLGMIALRFGRTRGERISAFVLALVIVAYIVSVAYTKSPLGLLM